MRGAFLPTVNVSSHVAITLQEVNSVEAIKSAVEANLGAAFVSAAAISKEKELGRLAVLRIQDIPLSRTLYCVTDPARYCRSAYISGNALANPL